MGPQYLNNYSYKLELERGGEQYVKIKPFKPQFNQVTVVTTV